MSAAVVDAALLTGAGGLCVALLAGVERAEVAPPVAGVARAVGGDAAAPAARVVRVSAAVVVGAPAAGVVLARGTVADVVARGLAVAPAGV
ncbi:MAG: hypothetical protein AB7P03_25435 [Kofleriaceae bacterium]